MAPRRAFLETAYTAALSVWLGVIVMTAVSAARTFDIVKDLAPTLGKYPSYTGDHWRIAAGKVVDTTFWWSDVAQVLCFIASTLVLVVLTMGRQLTFFAAAARWTAAGSLLFLLGYHLLYLGPRMSANLGQYWEAAAAGDNTRAEVFQSAFNADHPKARSALILIALSLVAALVVNAWSLTREKKPITAPTPLPPPQPGSSHGQETATTSSPDGPAPIPLSETGPRDEPRVP
jgi:hypothetical protein